MKNRISLFVLLIGVAACSLFAQQTDSKTVEYGDVLMRSLRVWPKNDADTNDTLATAKAFKVDKIVWIYENDKEFNDKVRAEGIGIGTTMADNARETWIERLNAKEIEEFVAKYTVRNLKGKQIIPEHFKPFTNAYTAHFVPDMTMPEWADIYSKYLIGLYAKGIDTIHRDDPMSTLWSMRYGGTFTDSAVEYFRKYLEENYNTEQLKELGVDDIAKFNIREHFLALGAPTDNMFWQWRGSPLMKPFTAALMKANTDFYVKVRADVEKATGRVIPWSLNGTGPYNDIDRFFDFRIGEYQVHHNQPQTLLQMSLYAVREGKMQALISMVDGSWTEHPEQFVRQTRRHIATAYASGMIPLVPWCMYMHKAPRYYGKVEDFGDLFHLVSGNRALFDGHKLLAASGIDTQAALYSYLPNKQLKYPLNADKDIIRINRENIFAFVRANGQSKVIHLVDWNESAQDFVISFNPADITGSPNADLTVIAHNKDNISIKGYGGGDIKLPAITPWALVKVEPSLEQQVRPAAPVVVSPSLRIVPKGTRLILETQTGNDIFWRIASNEEFKKYNAASAPRITASGVLETYSQNGGGEKSDILTLVYDVYDDYSAGKDAVAQAAKVKTLENSFSRVKGEMAVNKSFVADTLFMDGKKITNGISTKGNSLISCKVEPSWKYFTVNVGLDDAEDRRPCARFQVWFDSNLAYETPILNPSKLILDDGERIVFPIALRIPAGVSQIRLVSVNGGFFESQNHIVWDEPTAYK